MITLRYALIQIFFWMYYGNITSYASVYLLGCGFSNTAIGTLIAVASIISAVLQPVIASYADKEGSIKLKYIAGGISLIVAVFSAVIMFFSLGDALTAVFYGVTVTGVQLLMPFVNSIGARTMRSGSSLNFGISRGLGSAGYALLSYTMGRILVSTGYTFVPKSAVLLGILETAAILLYPEFKAVSDNVQDNQKASSALEFVRKYKKFCVILVGIFLLQIGHVLLNSFTYQITVVKGGDKAEMGIAMAIAAILELPMLFILTLVMKKIKVGVLFRASGVFLTLKVLGTLLAPNIPVFYAVQIFQMFGWAIMSGASVYYVNSIMDSNDAVKGQAYVTMAQTVASVAGALVCGTMIDGVGVSMTLLITTIISAVGMVILIVTGDDKKSAKA